MNYAGTLQTENYRDLGIAYIKGVLNTYASLNTPDSTLICDYNILKLANANPDLITAVKESFDVFKNQDFKLKLISNEKFIVSLESWLFETKFVSKHRIKRETDFVFELIKDICNFQSIYRIMDLDVFQHSYDFGISYDYFLLNGFDNSYLVYFNNSD